RVVPRALRRGHPAARRLRGPRVGGQGAGDAAAARDGARRVGGHRPVRPPAGGLHAPDRRATPRAVRHAPRARGAAPGRDPGARGARRGGAAVVGDPPSGAGGAARAARRCGGRAAPAGLGAAARRPQHEQHPVRRAAGPRALHRRAPERTRRLRPGRRRPARVKPPQPDRRSPHRGRPRAPERPRRGLRRGVRPADRRRALPDPAAPVAGPLAAHVEPARSRPGLRPADLSAGRARARAGRGARRRRVKRSPRVAVAGVPGAWSTERLAGALRAAGAEAIVVDLGRVSLRLPDRRLWAAGGPLPAVDGVVVKKIGDTAGGWMVQERINALTHLVAAGIPVLSEPARLLAVADRYRMTIELVQARLPIPETVVTEDPDEAAAAVERFGRAVLKPVF